MLDKEVNQSSLCAITIQKPYLYGSYWVWVTPFLLNIMPKIAILYLLRSYPLEAYRWAVKVKVISVMASQNEN